MKEDVIIYSVLTFLISGLASLVKCLLVARHGIIPPQLNYCHPNPEIAAVQEKKVTIVDKPTTLLGNEQYSESELIHCLVGL